MHEVTLMSGILDTLRENARLNGITRISRIKLIVGKFSMALPSSLRFAFAALAQEGLFQEAWLDIEERELHCLCQDCQREFGPQSSYCFVCPDCNGQHIKILAGREMLIDFYEGD